MIRLKNLDLESEGMKRHAEVSLGDMTGTQKYTIFAAPLDCVVEKVSVWSSRIKSNSQTVTLYLATATASTLAATYSSTASAYEQISMTITANNSLSKGQLLGVTLHCSGSDSFSKTIVQVKYKPNKHSKAY